MIRSRSKPDIRRPFDTQPNVLGQLFLPLFPALVISLLLLTSIWATEPANAGTTQCAGEEESKDYQVYVADRVNNRIQVFDSAGNFLRKFGSKGSADGQFDAPTGIAVDSGGNVYVTDIWNHRIQVFDNSGNFLRKFGSKGSGNSQFGAPNGIAVDGSGNVYVIDNWNHRVQVFDSSGNFLRKFGSKGSGNGEFKNVYAVAVDGSGNVYVTDTDWNFSGNSSDHGRLESRVQVFDSAGNFLRKWGSYGSGNGEFKHPHGIAVDSSGNVYVDDSYNHRVQVFDSAGNFLRKFGSKGSADGQFKTPVHGPAVDGSGNVYVSDLHNHRVQVFDSSGKFLTKWGSKGSADGQFKYPYGIAVDGSGGSSKPPFITPNCEASAVGSGAPVAVDARGRGGGTMVYLTQYNARDWTGDLKSFGINDDGNPGDQLWSATAQLDSGVPAANSRVLLTWGKPAGGKDPKTDSVGVGFRWNNLWPLQHQDLLAGTGGGTNFTFDKKWGSKGSGDGQLSYPMGIATDSSGNVYVADHQNWRVQVFDSSGNFLTNWGSYGTGNGQFRFVYGIAVDASGNVYTADQNRIQVFDSSGNFLRTWGSYGTGNGQFINPHSVTTDSSGNVYVADHSNHRVQVFDSSGNFLRKFGSYGTGNGQFQYPTDIAIDGNGNVYVVDVSNHRIQVFDSSGKYLRKFGSRGSANGQLFYPYGIATDSSGNVYVGDVHNQRIQVFDSSGKFLRKWGSQGTGDGQFENPMRIAFHGGGACGDRIYVVDRRNHRIQKFTNSSSGNEPMAKARLEYLRGDRSHEDNKGYKFRKRESLLGAIVHSRAIYVGKPMLGWPGAKYAKFKTTHLDREPIIYVGANDGALHGFRAKDGQEVIGYFPASVFDTAANSGLHYFTDPAYRHSYLVDGTPVVSDVFINNRATGRTSWRTVLVGTLRGGGRGLFALDVTNPGAFAEANAKSVVMWEFNNTHDAHLGYTFSEPTITLMNDGRWAAITGNGYEDTADDGTGGQAQLFIIYLDGGIDGEWTEGDDYLRISTGAGSIANRNGLATPAVVDLNGDGTADRAYAGDLEGNLWAFDLSDRVAGSWKVAYGSKAKPRPVFVARSEDGTAQPITVEPVVTRQRAAPGEPSPNLMVYFGTGRNILESDKTNTASQSFYGVWDRRQGNLARNALARQKILFESVRAGGKGRVTDPNLNVDYQWRDDTHYGWYLDLPEKGERVVSDPKVLAGTVFFNTTIPDGAGCGFGGKGWMMSVATHNGGSPEKRQPAFDFDENGAITQAGDTLVFRDRRYAYAGKMFDSGGAPAGPSLVATRDRYMRYTAGDETDKIDAALLTEVEGLAGRIAWQQVYPEIARIKPGAADSQEDREDNRNK